ncbi:serine/threonine-protein kinase [Nocardioides dilutus]
MGEPMSTVGVEPTAATDMAALLDREARTPEPEVPPVVVVADRYRVESLLGTGGMAHVLRATDLLLDRDVAVKLLRETPETDADLDRFLAETRTLARLSHPCLVTLLDGGTASAGRPYLVMEIVDGPPLSASLDAPVDPIRVAEIGSQVAAALAYAHAQGVVHRDVKPGNVLLRSDGRVKLADFGIAKLVGDQSLHTKTGTVLGSVHYLAPEQVAFEEITPAVDVYALGLLMLRCLTGHHAFEGPTVESALARLSADPEVPADLPSEWRDLLTGMTRRVAEERPSAADVATRLARLGGARATTHVATPAPDERPARAVPATWTRVSVSPVAVAAAILALALFVTAAIAGDGTASDDPPAAQPVAKARPAAQDDVVAAQETVPVDPGPDAVVPAVNLEPTAQSTHRAKAKGGKAKKDEGKHPGKGKAKGKGKGKGKPGKGR